jgi:ferredoxin--NADP+ reductase
MGRCIVDLIDKPKVVGKRQVSPRGYFLEIYHPLVANKAEAGQFVTIQATELSPRQPMQIVNTNPELGTFSILVETYNRATVELVELFAEGEELFNVEGPNGKPFPVEKYGSVLLIGQGWGAGANFPVAKALADAGNDIYVALVGGSRENIYCEKEYKELFGEDRVFVYTEDDEYGREGGPDKALEDFINEVGKPDLVVFAGTTAGGELVAEITKAKDIKNISLVPTIMLCTSGLCLTCRVKLGDKMVQNCIEGPYLDGNLVDWKNVAFRNGYYWDLEKENLEYFLNKLLPKLKRKKEREKKQQG